MPREDLQVRLKIFWPSGSADFSPLATEQVSSVFTLRSGVSIKCLDLELRPK